ncbi:hypothetical protein D3C75_1131340 [compost metagenome]
MPASPNTASAMAVMWAERNSRSLSSTVSGWSRSIRDLRVRSGMIWSRSTGVSTPRSVSFTNQVAAKPSVMRV